VRNLLNYDKIIRFNTSKYYFYQKEKGMEINIELVPVANKISETELSLLKSIISDGVSVDGDGVIKVKIQSKNLKKMIENIVNMK
jgi:hypothetical protein